MDVVTQIVAVIAGALVICFLAALVVAVIVVRLTGDSAGLRDLAVLIRAFGMSKLADALTGAARRPPDR